MHHPAYVDGCSVVVLRQGCGGFRIVESGILSFDGEALWFGEGESRRVFSEGELESLMLVTPNSRIAECHGFNFFVLTKSGA